MKTLIIVAHGSRLKESNEEIVKFTQSIKLLCENKFEIKYAFLELASPNIPDTIEQTIKENISQKIQILPYFLAEGKHVKVDIPNEVKTIQDKYINTNIEILPHLGKTEGLAQLILLAYGEK